MKRNAARRRRALPPATPPPTNFSALPVVRLDISVPRPNPRAARRHTAQKKELFTQVLSRFKYLAPILVNKADMRIIAGELRYAVAKDLGMTQIPAVVIGPLSEAEIAVLMVADNRLAELASWDEEMLAFAFETITSDDTIEFSAEITGFEAAKIDALMFGGSDFGEPPEPPVAPPRKPISQLGDRWTAGTLTLLHGDALSKACWAQAMGDRRAHMCLTDPPYNVSMRHISRSGRHRDFVNASGEMSEEEFIRFLTGSLSLIRAYLLPGRFAYTFMDGAHLFELFTAARTAGFKLKTLCTWAKTNAGMGSLYRSQTEHVAVFQTGSAPHVNNVQLGKHGRNRTTLWTHPGMNAFGRNRTSALESHGTVKPVALLADAILDVTRKGELIVDPFAGSGSTLIAAYRTGRACVGIELDGAHVDTTLARMLAVTGLDFIRTRDGARWSDLVKAATETPE